MICIYKLVSTFLTYLMGFKLKCLYRVKVFLQNFLNFKYKAQEKEV